tara:strand:+ start:115 stop:744 length:630 start_codon:yes stop_codon:yes gene_type:complete
MEENIDTEIWRKVEGYDDYSVSNQGRVKNKDGFVLNPSINSKGYFELSLYKNGEQKDFRVHRLVALAFIPNPNNLPMVNHINQYNKLDNRVSNLEWCTNLYNTQSINTIKNIGCVIKRNNSNGWQAKLVYFENLYQFSNPNEDKCWDWLYARRIELEYGLNLTELDNKTRKKGTGTICLRDSGRYRARIKKNSKTFDSYEDAEKWLETF